MIRQWQVFALALASAAVANDRALAQAATQLQEIVVSNTGTGNGRGDPQSPKGPGVGYTATRTDTATKTDTPTLVTPQSISTVTAQQIRDTGAQTISQAISYNAGIQTQPFGADVRAETFLVRGFTESTVGIYRDGLRQANAPFARFLNDPQDLERIDILKGPSSVLYGAGVPSGLVNLVSRTPVVGANFGYIAGDFGSFEYKQTRFDVNTQVGKDGSVWLRVSGLLRDANTQVPDQINNRATISPALTFLWNGTTTLTLLGNYSGTRGSAWPYYAHFDQPAPVSRIDVLNVPLGNPAYNSLRTNQNSFGYQFEHVFNDAFKIQQNFRRGYVGYDGQVTDQLSFDPAFQAAGVIPRYAQGISDQLNTIALDTRAIAKAHTGPVDHTLAGGVDYFRQAYTEVLQLGANMPNGGISPLTGGATNIDLANPGFAGGPVMLSPLFTPGFNSRTYQVIDQVGIYGQEQLAWGGLHLNLGGREDFSMMRTDNLLAALTPTVPGSVSSQPSAFTGRAGALYLFDSGLAPFVSYSTSFLPQAGTDAANNPFKPTTGEQIEGGVKYAPPGWRSTFTASYFSIANNNVLTLDPVNIGKSIQAGQIKSRGVEAEAVIGLTPGLNGIFSYSNTDVFVSKASEAPGSLATLGKTPIGVPRNLGAFFLDYTIQSGRFAGLGGGGGFRYIGRTFVDATNTITNKPVPAVDLLAHYDLGTVRFQLSIRNVADRRVPICNGSFCNFSLARMALGTVSARF